MKTQKSAKRPFSVDFFRGFFITCLFLGSALIVLYGVSAAQTATERVCFGSGGVAAQSAPTGSGAVFGGSGFGGHPEQLHMS